MTNTRTAKLLSALEANWQAEIAGHDTYTALAEQEADPKRRNLLRGLAAAERHHAELWAERVRALGGPVLQQRSQTGGDRATASVSGLNAGLALRRLEIDESRDIANYGRQLVDLDDGPSRAILGEVLADEREHYRILGELRHASEDSRTPEQAQAALDDLIASRNSRRSGASGWVGDAVYGVNDGLGSIFGIVSGVSGATLGNSHFVLIAGLAGMAASALSMGSGAYLAAKSEREIFDAEFAREREAVEYNEAEAREILALSYQVKGLPEQDARRFVEHLAGSKHQLVQALARERLNTTAEALRNPWTAASTGAVSTAVGAFIPIIPFFFLAGVPAILVAAAVSLVAHFAVGAAKALITMRSWWSSGLEMTAVGAAEGAVTYLIGIGLGHIGGGS